MGAVFFSGHYDLDYGHTWEELPDAIRYASVVLTEAAEVGEGAVSQVIFDDPDGDLVDVIVGMRDFRMDEDEAPIGNQNVYRGAIGDRTYGRGDGEHSSLIFDSQHQIACDLVDTNWFLDSRIFHGLAEANRPSETCGDRLRWLLTRQEFIGYDFGHVQYDDVNMLDAVSYDRQSLKNVLQDVILPGGYDYWVRWNETEDKSELFVIHPDSADYQSDARLTNVLAEADGSVTFLVNDDWTLKRSPSRVTGGVLVEFGDGDAVYDINTTTIDAFAWVDRVAPLANVKSEAAASQLVAKFLADNDEEDDRLSGSVFVPAAHVNDILPGQLVQGRFIHLPGYEEFRLFRVLRRTVRQEPRPAEPGYTLFLDLTPSNWVPVECSTSLSNRVTAHVSDVAGIAANGTTEFIGVAITPTAPASLLIGIGVGALANVPTDTNFVADGDSTLLYGANVPLGHPLSGVVYEMNVAPGLNSLDAHFTAGYGNENAGWWGFAAVAIPTAATSMVQEAHTVTTVGGASVTLDAPPTPGNLMIFCLSARATTVTPVDLYGDWTLLQGASAGFDGMWIFARCAQPGDPAGPWGSSNGGSQFCVVSEWQVI